MPEVAEDVVKEKPALRYRRVILKLSGESLTRSGERGIGDEEVHHIARQIQSAHASGCELAVGQHGDDIYVAHISVESRRPEARNAFATWVRHAPQPLYMAPIRAARQTGNYACYAFVSVAPLEIVRMDVRTRTIGGTDGRIMAIEPLTAPTSSSSRRRRHHSRNSQSRCIIL